MLHLGFASAPSTSDDDICFIRLVVLDVKAHVAPEPAGSFLRGAPGAGMRPSALPFPLFPRAGGGGGVALVIARAAVGPMSRLGARSNFYLE